MRPHLPPRLRAWPLSPTPTPIVTPKADDVKPTPKVDRNPQVVAPSPLLPSIPRPPAGFVSLFDGKTLTGWQRVGRAGDWSAGDGVLRYTGARVGHLRTTKSYANFELALEWRLPAGGSSGVFLRLNQPRPIGPNEKKTEEGLKIQLFDDRNNLELRQDHRAGSIVGILGPSLPTYRGPDHWHRFRILCQGSSVAVKLDDQLINGVSPERAPPPYRAALLKVPRQGPIGLQNLRTAVELRNIFIKELPASLR